MESAALLTKNSHNLKANLIEIHLSRDEACILNNSLNEVCYGFGLKPKEFEKRIGTKPESVIELLKKISREINTAVERLEDETDYLLKSPANAMQLERARQEFEAGQGIVNRLVYNFDDLRRNYNKAATPLFLINCTPVIDPTLAVSHIRKVTINE